VFAAAKVADAAAQSVAGLLKRGERDQTDSNLLADIRGLPNG
jgi:hypothetical protein